MVSSSEVRKRGWYYPHFLDRRGIANYTSYVEQLTDWSVHTELWRMYLSGQFVHMFSLIEDGEENAQIFGPERIKLVPRYGLSLLMTIYTVSDIYEFASRLCKQGYEEGIEIIIELHGMKDRRIITFDFGRFMWNHISKQDVISLNRIIYYESLLTEKKEYVINDISKIFQLFNWNNLDKRLIEQEYEKYVNNNMEL